MLGELFGQTLILNDVNGATYTGTFSVTGNSTNLDFWLPFKTRHKTHQFEIGPILETKNKAMSKYQNGYGLKSRYSFDNQNHLTQIGTSYRSITYSLDAPTKKAIQVNFDITFRPKMTNFFSKYRAEFVRYNAN